MTEKMSFLKTLSKNSATLSGMGIMEERRSSHTIIARVVRINMGMSQRGNLLKPGLKEEVELEGVELEEFKLMFKLGLELELGSTLTLTWALALTLT